MKYCEEYAALLDLFVDGELPTIEMERIQAHLEICPGCRGYVDDALAIRAGFPDVEDTVVPEGFAAGVMERVREDAGRRRSVRRRLGTFAALAACCALVIFARTGSGGLSGGNATMATASAGGATSTEYAMDTGGTDEIDDAWNDLERGMEPTAAPETARPKESTQQIEKETQTAAAMDSTAAEEDEEAEEPADDAEYGKDLPTVTLPESSGYYAAGNRRAALYLTVQEAGNLLGGYTPAWETASERWYELTEEEYRSLLEALGRPAEAAAAGAPLAAPVLVVVSGPFE